VGASRLVYCAAVKPLRGSIKANPRRALRGGTLLLAAAGLLVLAAAAQRQVTVVIDGIPRRIATTARTVGGAVRDAGLRLSPSDSVVPARTRSLQGVDRIDVLTARPVQLEVDGEIRQIVTAAEKPENILAEAGVRLFPGDRVWVDGIPHSISVPAARPSRLRLEHGYAVNLNGAGGNQALKSAGATLGEALWDSGVPLRAADKVFPSAGASLEGATGVRFEPARRISVEVDGGTVHSWAAGDSVGQALANAGVPLVGLDYAEPGDVAPLPANGAVRVVRVTEGVELAQTTQSFETRWEPSPDIEIDHQQLVDPGEGGVLATRTRVRYEDGMEIGRTGEPEWVAVEARDRIMGYGTKIVIRTLDTPNGPIEYWRAVPMYATSYSPCRLGVPGYCSTTMANGEELAHGNAAFIVRWYRVMRGQYVYVPGYGTAKISDTGGGIPGRRWIDLGYIDSEYVSWHGWVTVYFRTPVPPEGLIMWVLE
jgi:uncharacterized protein YabE (DUF348 family)